MPAPKSPITLLAEALTSQPALKGFVEVLAGKNKLAKGRSTPSIVIFPAEGGYDSPNDNVGSIVDIDLKVIARLWADNLDEAWDLRKRYIQALRQQAIGNAKEPMKATDAQAGVFSEYMIEAWDVEVDTSEQGQELEVTISVRYSAAPTLQLGTGEVDSTGLHGTQATLTETLASNDTVAQVDSTHGFASSGELYIDSEQISYTGLTAISFTGLTRGLNSTTPAEHDPAATVTQ